MYCIIKMKVFKDMTALKIVVFKLIQFSCYLHYNSVKLKR